MRTTRRRAGVARLQTLQAEIASAGSEKPVKPLASYFGGPLASKTERPQPSTADAVR